MEATIEEIKTYRTIEMMRGNLEVIYIYCLQMPWITHWFIEKVLVRVAMGLSWIKCRIERKGYRSKDMNHSPFLFFCLDAPFWRIQTFPYFCFILFIFYLLFLLDISNIPPLSFCFFFGFFFFFFLASETLPQKF